jgi:hypothetical protein
VYDREFAAAALDLGVAERIAPVGWLDGNELACAYAATDVFVTPSICFDTFGLVNLEAMEHSRPVVATSLRRQPGGRARRRDGPRREPLRHGSSGRCDPRLARRSQALAARMGEAGRLRLLERFQIRRLADEFLEEYDTADAQSGRLGRFRRVHCSPTSSLPRPRGPAG